MGDVLVHHVLLFVFSASKFSMNLRPKLSSMRVIGVCLLELLFFHDATAISMGLYSDNTI
ncbi:ORF1287 [White spot syndrome virus]|uniref:ORF1287 n=1 Tax=White spot syndrome virus TaxID=342409 RepID=A0A2D3I7A6_9VIRU|nr:ORF1287 [White spot syndrome virus]